MPGTHEDDGLGDGRALAVVVRGDLERLHLERRGSRRRRPSSAATSRLAVSLRAK